MKLMYCFAFIVVILSIFWLVFGGIIVTITNMSIWTYIISEGFIIVTTDIMLIGLPLVEKRD